jgi:diguanylate cyclase (GGDEF)-like protein
MNRQTILVVDDEPNIRQILKYQLEKLDYEVKTAENGEAAIEIVREDSVDLVLLDIMMPKMDGYQVCRKLREDFKTSKIPIIMLTAKGDLPDRIRGLEEGVNDYLVKPYSQEELAIRVRNVLEWNTRQLQANPLTGLPGNIAIEGELARHLEAKDSFAFMYVDIDNFKAYNDFYGYRRGDRVIAYLARVLSDAVKKLGNGADFIGHVGGDDFVLITSPARAEFIAKHLIDEFDQGSIELLDEQEVRRGFMELPSRSGGNRCVPLMSLTVALVVNSNGQIRHFAEVNDIASELKKYGKSLRGSVVVRERRRP